MWLEDLQQYEQERLKQIQREAGDALSAGDTATGVALAEELEGTPWSESPPKALFDRVSVTRRETDNTPSLPRAGANRRRNECRVFGI